MNTESRNRRNQYFVPGEGIAREVITADICKYLDNDATVRPGDYQGRPGYYIYAYRNLTTEMIADLKSDSIRWEQEKAEKARQKAARPAATAAANSVNRARGSGPMPSSESAGAERYTDSRTHESRQLYGPSSMRDTPSPGASNYPPARQPPPPQEYRPPGTGSYGPDSQYPMHPPSNYPPQARQGYNSGYPPEPEQGYPGPYIAPPQGQDYRGQPPAGYDYHSRFPQDPNYDYPNHARQAQHPANVGRQFVPQTSSAPPPQSDLFYSDPRAGARPDQRMENRPYPDERYYPDGRRRN